MRRYLTVAVLLLFWAALARAQTPDVRPYESEEDLWEALREGEIEFDEFLELLDIHRVGADDIVLPQSDWEQLPGSDVGYLTSPDTANSLTTFTETPAHPETTRWNQVRYQARFGYDADLIAPTGGDGYTIARLRYGEKLRALIDWQQDGRDGIWRRRSLTWDIKAWRYTFGNFEPRWGRGLVIGRRSRFLGATSNRPLSGSFASPTRSRFDGLRAEYGEGRNFSGGALVSNIRSGELYDLVAAGHIEYGRDKWRIGWSGLSGRLERDTTATPGAYPESNPSHGLTVSGLHVRVGDEKRAFLGEIAVADNDATAKAAELLWPLSRGKLHARAWSYSANFINPWGGGPAHSDRETVILDSIDEEYATRTTGERGFSLTTQIDVSRATHLRWQWMTHKEAPTAPLIHHWSARARVRAGDLSVTPFARGKSVEDGEDTYSLGSYATYGDTDNRVDARFEVGRHHVDADAFIRAGAGIRRRLNAHVRLAPTVRWVDPDLDSPNDAYWYFYFTETVFPGPLGQIEAALVWQRYENRSRADRIELRLRSIVKR